MAERSGIIRSCGIKNGTVTLIQKELEKNGKKLAYVGLITTGVKDQMKEIAVVIFGYGTYGDQGYKIYHLFAEQYVKP